MRLVLTTRQITRHRGRAARRWSGAFEAAHGIDATVPAAMPRYFIDRYAVQELPAFAPARGAPPVPPAGHEDRLAYLSGVVRPTARLGGWAPDPAAPTGAGTLYCALRTQWRAFCRSAGLPPVAGTLPDAPSMTWQQVLDDSVFYPGPPVFRGATYLDALDEDAAAALISAHGEQGAVDFFCFMLQVHETVHRAQTGEPLLNEVVQAALWARFLTEHRLWQFQRNADGALVREAGVVQDHPELVQAAASAGLDTARLMHRLGAPWAYMGCCALANRFDNRMLNYDAYLAEVSHLLSIRRDRRHVEEVTAALLP